MTFETLYRNISVAEAKALLAERKPVVLDCRKIGDYQAGHIEGAMHAHDGLIESLIKRDKETELLIYCYHGHASQHLAELFSGFGFKHVYSLVGGYQEWQAPGENGSAGSSAAG